MNEEELLAAVVHFGDMCRKDPDIAMMRTAILSHGHESIGHFCRADPEAFVELYEAAKAMLGLDDEFDKYIEIRDGQHNGPVTA